MTAHPLEREYRGQMHFLRLWRIGHRLHRWRVPLLPGLVRILCRIVFNADVPIKVDIPRGVVFMHNGLGTVVHTRVVFEGPALVFHHVTLGNAKTIVDGTPTIGSHVLLGAGAVVLGPVRIGHGCVVGANAVVTKDVPSYHMALGNPAVLRPCDPALIRHLFGSDPPHRAIQPEAGGADAGIDKQARIRR